VNEEWIGGYDIINEPNWGFEDPKGDFRGISENKNEPLKELMVAITNAIREVDRKHIIIIEGNGFGNNYKGIMPPWDSNMVMSFHKYGNFNTPDAIKGFLELRSRYNIPLWLGESGENSNTWFTEAIQLVENNAIGWAWWQLKKMGISNPLEIKRPEGYDKLLAYWSGKGPKPTETEAWFTLQELLENLKIENNIYHKDVVDAMIRQVRSTATQNFKQHTVTHSSMIRAVDYDLGRHRFAYFDMDTARYQYTPGVKTEGNKGYTYRNDGVDIQLGDDGPYVFDFGDGEWLQYTVYVNSAGIYDISFVVAADIEGTSILFRTDHEPDEKELAFPRTGGLQVFKTATLRNISLKEGVDKFRVIAKKGGFNLAAIQIEKK
jgi:hypothetical protein